MAHSCFDVELDNHIAHIRFSRPDAFNSMIRDFWYELPEILQDLDRKAEARVVVLSSTGKHFTSGMDLSVFAGEGMGKPASQEVGRQREELRRMVLQLQDSFTAIERVRMPVLAAIQGGCIGGGVDLISACDARYCTDSAFFCIQEINIGMTADVGTLQRLPHLIPDGMMRELAYTGRRLPAQRALDIGLVNEMFATQDAMLAAVMEIAREISERSPLAIYGTKEMLNYSRDHSVADSLNYMATWQTGMFQAFDMFESFAAKGDKRAPNFENLTPRRKYLGES